VSDVGTTGALAPGPVLVVGAGLIGTSIAMALARHGVTVHLVDTDPVHSAVAASRVSGGRVSQVEDPVVVVVATPPDHLAAAIEAALMVYPGAVVTDVGSVKVKPLSELRSSPPAGGVDLSRYVGSHPMAGSERSGPLAAAADLFDGRSWAVTPHETSRPEAVAAVEGLVSACGAVAVRLSPEDHDLAVARISHLPHLMAAVMAGRLDGAPPAHLALSGPGVRDVTRIAAGDPRLWRQIVSANAAALHGLLRDVHRDVEVLMAALDDGDVAAVEALLAAGANGAAAIPGKHGGPAVELVAVTVTIPDRPGALAELFNEVGMLGVNIEDVRIDHDPARAYGLVEIDVAEGAGERLAESLRERGWAAHR
jgi:prephenate dehydrogenase